MKRIVSPLLASLMLAVVLGGCTESTPEDAEMSERREPPAETRKPPGALSGGEMSAEEGEAPPPSGDE